MIEFGKENTSADEKTETKNEIKVEQEQGDKDTEADDEDPLYLIKHVTCYGNRRCRRGRRGYQGLQGRRYGPGPRDSRYRRERDYES